MADDRDLERARTAPRNNNIWLFLAVGLALMVIVIHGSYFHRSAHERDRRQSR